VLAVNGAANILPLNGVNTGRLSDELPNLFVPAGLTFSIWGLIYLLLAGYAIALCAEVFGERARRSWDSHDGFLFLINACANMGWIFAWHWRNLPLSLCLMLVILGSLIALEEGNASRLRASGSLAGSGKLRRFFLTVPINVYLGWIMVATIANVTALLVKLGWNGFGLDPRFWTVLVIAVGAALAMLLAFSRKAIAAPAVVVWAFAGIALKRLGVDADYSRAVWLAAIAGAALIACAVLIAQLSRPGLRHRAKA
jgi:hypothetical protein